mgnify:CR=1 FL=1
MNKHITAARIHQTLSIIYFALGILMALAALASLASPAGAGQLQTVVALLMLGMGAFHRAVSKGARQRAPWARTCSNAIAVLMLFGFPVGTAIGTYLLLNRDWSGNPRPESVPAGARQSSTAARGHDGDGWFDTVLSGLNRAADQSPASAETPSISNVVDRGGQLFIYDQNGRHIRTSGIGPNCHLTGYTGSTYSVRNGNVIYTYDIQGRQISNASAT